MGLNLIDYTYKCTLCSPKYYLDRNECKLRLTIISNCTTLD